MCVLDIKAYNGQGCMGAEVALLFWAEEMNQSALSSWTQKALLLAKQKEMYGQTIFLCSDFPENNEWVTKTSE